MKPGVVLLSGGIDSSTALAIAQDEGFEVHALSFDYGQRHTLELNAAEQYAQRLNVKNHIIIYCDMRDIGGSALISDIPVPKNRLHISENSIQIKKKESHDSEVSFKDTEIPATYVPARNTIFLSFALSLAESISAKDIFIGVNAVDYSGYPDCRPEFINAFEQMANLATKKSVEQKTRYKIHTPLINLTKGEIIKRGRTLGCDYSLTWSCYDPQEERATRYTKLKSGENRLPYEFWNVGSRLYIPCMRCDSCILRTKGFKSAGAADPLLQKLRDAEIFD
jgi:7-cyano-7-deazaguanine synthase